MTDTIVVTQSSTSVVAVPGSPVAVNVTTTPTSVTISNLTGPQGPQGPPGINGAASYVHTQALASATWTVTHNLGWFPNVTVLDSTGRHIEGDVAYTNSNVLVLTFAASFAGTAYLS